MTLCFSPAEKGVKEFQCLFDFTCIRYVIVKHVKTELPHISASILCEGITHPRTADSIVIN